MDSFQEIWSSVCEMCKSSISNIAYNIWISKLEPLDFEDGKALLIAPSEFHKKVIKENYLEKLSKAFEEIMGVPIQIEISVKHEQAEQSESDEKHDDTPATEYEYYFDNFIVGASNKFAHAASQAVAERPGLSYNPLFIYGDSGLGKTHLLYAIKNEIIRKHPDQNIVFIKGDEFANELIESIRMNNTTAFKKKYRNIDVLLVDDIHFIAGKNSTQEEFFHTFNTLYQDRKQIVLTSDRAPKEIQSLEDRLRTRFEWGLLADIQPPDFETRIAIIKRKAEHYRLDLSDDVCAFLANKIRNNVRQLEGTVRKMNAYYLLDGEAPTLISAQNAIKDIFNDNQPVPVTIEKIISEVARTFEVTVDDIRSNKRAPQFSKARHTAIYVVREITQMSLASIGDEFGKRDHSTIVYAIQQAEKNMKKDSSYKATVEDIIKNIRDN